MDTPPPPAGSMVDTICYRTYGPSHSVLQHCSAVNWQRGDPEVFSGVGRNAPFLYPFFILPFPSVGSEGCHTPVSKPGLARTRHEQAKIQGDPTRVVHGGLTGQMHIPGFSKPWGMRLKTGSVALSCPTLPPHGLQHARLPCPSQSPRACHSKCPPHSDSQDPHCNVGCKY